MKIKQTTSILLSGTIWFSIGIALLAKGLNFLITIGYNGGGEQTALILLVLALLLGFLKAKFVLAKTVNRQVKRILSFSNPFPLRQLYPPSYYAVILSMILLGIAMRYLPISLLWRGSIDVAIGSALINAAVLYYRNASLIAKKDL